MGYAVHASKFQHVMTVQQQTVTVNADGMGGSSATWADWKTNVRCAVKPYTGREYWAAGQEQTKADMVFNVRYFAGLTAKMRIIFKSQTYDITSPPVVDWNNGGREMFIAATLRTEGS